MSVHNSGYVEKSLEIVRKFQDNPNHYFPYHYFQSNLECTHFYNVTATCIRKYVKIIRVLQKNLP